MYKEKVRRALVLSMPYLYSAYFARIPQLTAGPLVIPACF